MALQQVFSLTPRDSYFNSGYGYYAGMECYGITFIRKQSQADRYSFDHQHTSDEVYFRGDRSVPYALVEAERRHAPHVALYCSLYDFGPHKEVALTFRFDAVTESRILVYTSAGFMGVELLHPGDDQFLIEVESTNGLWLYFIHAHLGLAYGGNWFFQGIDGYIA